MSSLRVKITDRILAAFLALVMVIGLLPATAVHAVGGEFTITVEDAQGPVESATIKYTVKVDDKEQGTEQEIQTGQDGTAKIDLSAYESDVTGGKNLSITYTVTKDGYAEKSNEIEVTNIAGSETITLTKVTAQTAKITVSAQGNGSVKVNGAAVQDETTVTLGEEATLEVTADAGSYIKELTIDGESKPIEKVETFSDTIKVEKDIVISVVFMQEYTVSVEANEGGTVQLNEETKSEITVDENSKVNLSVTPDEGYQIASVSIDRIEETITDPNSFTKEITVTDDVAVVVSFVKIYTVTVSYNKDGGTVVTTPDTAGGSVVVQKGETINIQATPKLNYRVSQVLINGNKDTKVKGENNETYSRDLEVDDNYTIEITFALNQFKITASETEHGKVIVLADSVEFGKSSTITMEPDAGYTVGSVKINDTEVQNSTGDFSYTIEKIDADQKVEVTFKELSDAENSSVSFNKDVALRIDENAALYVFKEGAKVTFTTEKEGLRITCSDNEAPIGGEGTKSIDFTDTTVISKIELLYQADGEWVKDWHPIAGINDSKPIRIVMDTEKPTLKPVFGVQPNENGYYNSNIPVTITAEDPGNYSGLESVEYWVECDGKESAHETLYTYQKGEEIYNTYTKENITIDAKVNNSDNVTVYFSAMDRAGNEVTQSQKLKINSTKPEIKVSIDGTPHPEAQEGYYNSTRTAIVTIIDRPSCFDKQAVKIEINAKEPGISVPAMISWKEESGKDPQAIIVFSAESEYNWNISYTNKAGLSNNGIAEETGSSIYKFTVDKSVPTGSIWIDTHTWDSLLSKLTFGIWKNSTITAEAKVEDTISPTYDVLYYKAEDMLNAEQLEAVYKAGKFTKEPVTSGENEKLVVYARLTDYAGNTQYISTNGMVSDMTSSKIQLKYDQPNQNGFYNTDVTVNIDVNENLAEAYSGIRSIEYMVTSDGNVTQSGKLYDFVKDEKTGEITITDWSSGKEVVSKLEGGVPAYDQLISHWSGFIVVDAEKNNSDDVKVIVTVTDNAGNTIDNTQSQPVDLAINIDEPTAKVEFNDNAVNVADGCGYFNAARKAKITIYDRASAFDEKAAIEGFTVKAVDVNGEAIRDNQGNVIQVPYTLGEWQHNGDEHWVEITFPYDGVYDWSYQYTNKADNSLDPEKIDTGDSVTPNHFAVDTGKPSGKIIIGENVWDKLLKYLTFGLYTPRAVEVDAQSSDTISPIWKVEYYKTNSEMAALSWNELDQKEFTNFKKFSVNPDEQFVVYLKVTDMAGNYQYISSDGYIVDATESVITLTPDAPNKNNIYNGDVHIGIRVEDPAPYSGIHSIDYMVVKDEDMEHPTQNGNLFLFDTKEPAYDDLLSVWDTADESNIGYGKEIVVDKSLNNSSDVKVIVTTIDNAGNTTSESIDLDIDITPPKIQITYDNNADNHGNGYFDANRTATVVITERTNHFDASEATKGIHITAQNARNQDVKDAYTISQWETQEGDQPDEATHTATIFFEKDANYVLNMEYTDKADNENTGVDPGNSVAPYKFTVDTTSPTGTITAASAEGRKTQWEYLVNELTFGFWSKKQITITGNSDDATSPIAAVEYYKVTSQKANDGTKALSKSQLDAISQWKPFSSLKINDNQQFTIYLRITDMAGNYSYISTDGLIVDNKAPVEEMIAPEITLKPEQPINGLYNGDVKVNIQIQDPLTGGTYSGLKTVSYRVLNMGVETQSGTLYSFNVEKPHQNELRQIWKGSITVNSKLNNSNDVVVEVYAEDNSLNSSKDRVKIKIDITDPTIQVSYNNNRADSEKYFKEERTATIVVTERNFDPDDVKITITNTEGVIPAVSKWAKTAGSGNLDNTRWTANITYHADGDYKFDIAYIDLANNKCAGAEYGNSVAPREFTIDRTIPTVQVSYNNNSAQNGNYYKESRTATVTIREHNFNTDRVKVTMSAVNGGKTVSVPAVSGWSKNGDVHTATITYSQDALYSFEIGYTDMAGNEARRFEKQTFYVDKTAPKLDITGVSNQSANSGDVIPVVSCSDINFDADTVSIILTGANRKNVALEGSLTKTSNGQTFTFKNFAREKDIDDIYTLTAKLTDKAGNSTEKKIVFSINRFGSTYGLSESVEKLNGSYVKSPEDVIITETNANELKNIRITLFKNNETIVLKEGENYKISVTGGDGKWYQYVYTVFADNFADDGVYRLSFHSEDAAGNVAENTLDTKDKEISFGIDSTNPTITITNLESGKTYALENLSVVLSANDNLLLKSVEVYLDDYGKVYKSWNEEEIAEILKNNEDFIFDISDDSTEAHKLKIVCTDASGNKVEEEIVNFYVTTNLMVRYYNNKTLFFGSIIGAILLVGVAVFWVVYKKKKNTVA